MTKGQNKYRNLKGKKTTLIKQFLQLILIKHERGEYINSENSKSFSSFVNIDKNHKKYIY